MALVAEANKHSASLCPIIIKYFEPGHTFMSADSFHHRIEKSIRKKGRLDNFHDFVSVAVKTNGEAIIMMADKDFFLIPRTVS